MANDRAVPYGAFNFRVTFVEDDSITGPVGGFSDVSGMNTEFMMAEYRAGNDPEHHVHKVPGMHKVGDVTLKRGIIDSAALFAWIRDTRQRGYKSKRTVKITLYDEAGASVLAWRLLGASPLKYTGPTLTGKGGNEVAMEELVLSCEGFDFEQPVAGA